MRLLFTALVQLEILIQRNYVNVDLKQTREHSPFVTEYKQKERSRLWL